MSLASLFGIGTAYAASAAPHAGQSMTSMFLMLGALVFFMYFIVIRPQSKRAKEHRSLIGGLKKGDEVLTSGGVLGKIVKLSDNFVVIAIAEGVEITVQKPAIATSVPKGTMKSV